MSAAHVLAPLTKASINVAEENHYIYQPGKPDAAPVPDGLCGRLAAHIALSSQTTNSFDAAFAHIAKGWGTGGREFKSPRSDQ
jgi:hypothetical protein